MEALKAKLDGYVQELGAIEEKYKQASEQVKVYQNTVNNLVGQYNDKRSRIAELNELIEVETNANPECSVDNQPNA